MLFGGQLRLVIKAEVYDFMKVAAGGKLGLNRNFESRAILKKIAAGEKSAVKDCVNFYGDAIWRLVRKSVVTVEDAENVILEIFGDIWKFAGDVKLSDCREVDLIGLIIKKRLNIYREQNILCDSQVH